MYKLGVCVAVALLTIGCGDDDGGGSSGGTGGDGSGGGTGTGGSDTQQDAENICDALCDCSSCTASELEGCENDFATNESMAEAEGCGSDYAQFLDCYVAKVECVNGNSTLEGCDTELTTYYDCIGADASGG